MSEKKQETGRVQLPTGVEELTRRVAAIERNFALMVVDLSEDDRRTSGMNFNTGLLLAYLAFLVGIYVGRLYANDRKGRRE